MFRKVLTAIKVKMRGYDRFDDVDDDASGSAPVAQSIQPDTDEDSSVNTARRPNDRLSNGNQIRSSSPDHSYVELMRGSVPCPTCRGVGNIPKGNFTLSLPP